MEGERSRVQGTPGDVRLRGFAERVPVEEALRWIDRIAAPLPAEEVVVENAAGRVLAAPLSAAEDLPPADCAAADGYALRAADTIGAGDYNPLHFVLFNREQPLAPMSAVLISAGEALPPGADAVLPFATAEAGKQAIEVFAAAAEGTGVERRGRQLRKGSPLFAAGRRLRAPDSALLSLVGLGRLPVVRRPRVALRLAGPKPVAGYTARDGDGPMLRRLIERDGGIAVEDGADLILRVGRSGAGVDDDAAVALAAAGELAIHGIAISPGGSAGMGYRGSVPEILLPGEPFAAMTAYEFFAGRLIRRLGGRAPDLPHRLCEAELARKIVSAVGLREVWPVSLAARRAIPQGSPEGGGLTSAVRADGFIVVPEACEGYAPGTRIAVHLYER